MKILPVCLLVCLPPLQIFASESMSQICRPDTLKSYKNFKRQHIDAKMTAQKCTLVMKQKNIYENDKSCKKTNTFILANGKEVKSICKDQGVYNSESHCTASKKKFRLVVCDTKKNAKMPRCEYKGRLVRNRIVVVKCQDGLPVHYETDHSKTLSRYMISSAANISDYYEKRAEKQDAIQHAFV